ncbi:hypothetical protein N0V94_003140 [Neodidymelliopsis sp. IMI 364377]|nr:hypothetical protein N0V94_003140 [Neodidymelliopsis sp. IMI 364377]
MFHFRWFSKPAPAKPAYYKQMNPEEQVLWNIIGEETHVSYRNKKGKVRTRRLTREERAHKQRMFFDHRAGKGIVGDDWMRMELPGTETSRRRGFEISR